MKLLFFSISISPNVKISLFVFIFENDLFIFHNILLFLFKSAYCSTFAVSLFLIPVIIQRLLTPQKVLRYHQNAMTSMADIRVKLKPFI